MHLKGSSMNPSTISQFNALVNLKKATFTVFVIDQHPAPLMDHLKESYKTSKMCKLFKK